MNDADRPPSLADLRGQLRLVFTTEAAVDDWLSAPDPSLGGFSPRSAASQPSGLQRVQDLIVRMIHGIPP
jgi:uncharacterized protein (DUF2384 family)